MKKLRLDFRIGRLLSRVNKVSAAEQKLLMLKYREEGEKQGTPLSFRDVGFRVHSQHDEDGILLYVFSLIGVRHYTCVEVCAGNGIECNCANLILNHGWTGLLVDGDRKNVELAHRFYSRDARTQFWPPTVRHAWLTRDNLNEIIEEAGISGEVDLLSLDVDGNDLHFWRALEIIRPRLVVAEINCLWGADASCTVPYDEHFKGGFTEWGSDYAGASLPAFIKVAKEKGYHLIGTNAISTNAFFLRDDIRCDHLPEREAGDCFKHPRAVHAHEKRLPGVREKKWENV